MLLRRPSAPYLSSLEFVPYTLLRCRFVYALRPKPTAGRAASSTAPTPSRRQLPHPLAPKRSAFAYIACRSSPLSSTRGFYTTVRQNEPLPAENTQEQVLPVDDLYSLEKHEPFFRNTTYRYLWNEAESLSCTRFEYYIPGLHHRFTSIFPHVSCESITKLVDEKTHKFLRFDVATKDRASSPTVFAKVYDKRHVHPSQIHAEVATLFFANRILGISTPTVVAYSADSNSAKNDRDDVGAPYIVFSIPPGSKVAYEVWPDMKESEKLHVIDGLIAQQKRMLEVTFHKHGSLYFKHQPLEWGLDGRHDEGPLLASFGRDVRYDIAEKVYTTGASAKNEYWEGDRKNMDLDRGPWSTPAEELDAMLVNEMHILRDVSETPFVGPCSGIRALATSPAEFRAMEFHPDSHLSLLLQSRAVLPHLIPASPDLTAPRLFNNATGLSQLFLTGSGEFGGFLDWSETHVAPLFRTAAVPAITTVDNPEHPALLVDSRTATPDVGHYLPSDAQEVLNTYSPSILASYWAMVAARETPALTAALALPHIILRDQLITFSYGSWCDGGWLRLLQVLIRLQRCSTVSSSPSSSVPPPPIPDFPPHLISSPSSPLHLESSSGTLPLLLPPIDIRPEDRAYLTRIAGDHNALLDLLDEMRLGKGLGHVTPTLLSTAGQLLSYFATSLVHEHGDEGRKIVQEWRLTDWRPPATELGKLAEGGFVHVTEEDMVKMFGESPTRSEEEDAGDDDDVSRVC